MSSEATAPSVRAQSRSVGRYRLYDPIARGGMATVHIGRLVGPVGFARTVAVKCLHAQLADDPEFVSMFRDEARLASRVRHPNVVSTLDVVSSDGELFLIMDYVQGESLAALLRAARRAGEPVPHAIVTAILGQALLGLHAAHEATSDQGTPLAIVHRDVSPQNILVGTDGVARVADFGVAWAAQRAHSTQNRGVKGKVQYMAPEQLFEAPIDRRADVFTSAVVLWEALTGQQLFGGDLGAIVGKHASGQITPPSALAPSLPPSLDAVVMRALSRDPDARFPTARSMAEALETALPPAGALAVGDWVERLGHEALARKRALVARIEADMLDAVVAPAQAETAAFTGVGALVERAPSARSKVLFGTGVLAVALAVVATWFWRSSRDGGAEEARDATASEAPAPAGSEAPAPPAVSEPKTIVSPDPAPSVEPSPPAALVKDTRAKAAPRKEGRLPGKPARPGCDPPYVIRADGSKQFIKDCF